MLNNVMSVFKHKCHSFGFIFNHSFCCLLIWLFACFISDTVLLPAHTSSLIPCTISARCTSTRLIIINKNVFFNKYNTMAISSDIHPRSSTDRQKLTSQTVWGHELWHHSAVKGLWPWHCHEDPAASWLWYLTHSVQWEEDWWVHNKLLENPICAAPPNASAACCDVTWIIYTLLWDMFHMSFTIQQSSWMSTRLQWIQNH